MFFIAKTHLKAKKRKLRNESFAVLRGKDCKNFRFQVRYIRERVNEMLQLIGIKKDYISGEQVVNALKGVDISFRDAEFVSILGQSGCGKTTLLNLIGGLDAYTDGDLIIDGVSTRHFKNREWDNYRNHQIGFVFQNYNLIPHQSVVGNVELALVLSGVSKEERRNRAIEALTMVGLSDVIYKLPNQLSGGQVQRVAIARAIVNNPKIILADEPTGALDSETSLQVMEILKSLSADRLIIMVTHNGDLADAYSTRIVRLRDGLVASDSNPYAPDEETIAHLKEIHLEKVREFKDLKKRKMLFFSERKLKMSFKTAFLLSIRNLMSKKTRTILTSVAGSIGIIGIALISSISNGANGYIHQMEQDTLSQYPLQIETSSIDYMKFLDVLLNRDASSDVASENKVLIHQSLTELLNDYSQSSYTNDLKAFKKYLESGEKSAEELLSYASSVEYLYRYPLNIYYQKGSEILQVSPDEIMESVLNNIEGGEIDKTIVRILGNQIHAFASLLPDKDGSSYNASLIQSQYDLIGKEYGSRWPENKNECLLVVDSNNRINDYAYFALGLGDPADLVKMINGQEVNLPEELDLRDLLNLRYKIILPTDSYVRYDTITLEDSQTMDLYEDLLADSDRSEEVLKNLYERSDIELNVVGILRPKKQVSSPCIRSTIAYLPELTEFCNDEVIESEVYAEQAAHPDYSVFTGRPLKDSSASKEEMIAEYLLTLDEDTRLAYREEYETYAMTYMQDSFRSIFAMVEKLHAEMTIKLISSGSESDVGQEEFLRFFDVGFDEFHRRFVTEREIESIEFSAKKDGEQIYYQVVDAAETIEKYEKKTYETFYEKKMGDYFSTYEDVMNALNVNDNDIPFRVYIYASDFNSKDRIISLLSTYNQLNPSKTISYTDYVGMMMDSANKIVDSVTYILLGCISVSLVVSSIMIGIITYISVLERTKEIGILRSLGASNKDVFVLFNAETITLGLCAGLIGILATALITIPINMILNTITGVGAMISLTPLTAVMLILISALLSFVSGLIPSQMASKKNPVIALRSEG